MGDQIAVLSNFKKVRKTSGRCARNEACKLTYLGHYVKGCINAREPF
jgi:hypothetical protein